MPRPSPSHEVRGKAARALSGGHPPHCPGCAHPLRPRQRGMLGAMPGEAEPTAPGSSPGRQAQEEAETRPAADHVPGVGIFRRSPSIVLLPPSGSPPVPLWANRIQAVC